MSDRARPFASEAQLRAEAEVLQANASFYQAFSRGDHRAMAEVWAERAPVACIHPGGPPLSGRGAVLGSFQSLLSSAPRWRLEGRAPRVLLLGETAVVTCLEANGDEPAHLAATNAFVLERDRWRMVHHQAGPLQRPIEKAPPAPLAN